MNYKIVENSIVETATGNIIKTDIIDNLKVLRKKLNFGSGFDGWTPSFFLLNIKHEY